MITEGRPRYWVAAYDRWHLALPILLLAAIAWILLAPRSVENVAVPAVTLSNADVAVARPAQGRSMASTTIQSPHEGAVFWVGKLGDAEGTAEPGSTVRLFLGPKILGEAPVDSTGRFRFQLVSSFRR